MNSLRLLLYRRCECVETSLVLLSLLLLHDILPCAAFIFHLHPRRHLVQAAQELGVALTPVKETLVDMAVTLIQLGIATPRLKSTG